MADSTRTPVTEGLAARRAAVVSCWLCGTRLHRDHMVPDGSSACADIQWYCQDVPACTERWTTARRQVPAGEAVAPGDAIAVSPIQAAKPSASGSTTSRARKSRARK